MIHDITPPVSPALKVWPGDTPLSREVLLDLARGDAVTLSALRATVHLGAHADAPSHFDPSGATIEARPLDPYLGPCRVVGVEVGPNGLVGPGHLDWPVGVERVLLRTGTYPDPNAFREDFAALAPELIERLADEGVRLVGVDTPSVDPFASKALPAHRACGRRGLAILEVLALGGVPDGLYELIALPLRLVGFDASPVRAVLRPLGARGPVP
jgi:arylformamidase